MGLAGGVTRTSGQTQTTLAAACAPPAKKHVMKRGNLIAISILAPFFALGVHWILFVISLAVIGFGWTWSGSSWKLNSKYNEEVWPQLYQNWTESWICHKCGSVYQQK